MTKLLIGNIKVELSVKSWVLLSTQYENLDGDLEMMCPEGHKVFISLKKWRKKAECPTCSTNIYNTLKNTTSIQKKSGIYRILALDDSTSITGWAVFDNEELVGYGKIEMTQKSPIERISAMKQWMLSMVAKWKPDLVAIEDIQQQENVQIFKVLAQLQGVLLNALYENKYEFDIIHVATWRSHCEIKGKTRSELKKNAQAKIKTWYDVSVTQDEADAICLGRCAIYQYVKNNEFYGWDTE
jgi:Holliday junction resolvasome RuvABC endonuclease subunit